MAVHGFGLGRIWAALRGLPDGSASAPALAFANALDAGLLLFNAAARSVRLKGGSGGATATGGVASLQGGPGGSTSGQGGTAQVQGGTPIDGDGGNVSLVATAGVGTNRNGGGVNLTAGNATGSGVPGDVKLTLSTGGNLLILNIPTSATGLPTGAVYSNSGVLTRVP